MCDIDKLKAKGIRIEECFSGLLVVPLFIPIFVIYRIKSAFAPNMGCRVLKGEKRYEMDCWASHRRLLVLLLRH